MADLFASPANPFTLNIARYLISFLISLPRKSLFILDFPLFPSRNPLPAILIIFAS